MKYQNQLLRLSSLILFGGIASIGLLEGMNEAQAVGEPKYSLLGKGTDLPNDENIEMRTVTKAKALQTEELEADVVKVVVEADLFEFEVVEFKYSKSEIRFQLFESIRNGNLKHFKKWFKELDSLNFYGPKRNTPLHLAASYGRDEMVTLLLEEGNVEVDPYSEKGNTPLHLAAENGHLSTVKILREHGADLNSVSVKGNTPLHQAAAKGRFKVVQYLVGEGAILDALSKKGNTPAHLAAEEGHLDVIIYLAEMGAWMNIPSDAGNTPLDRANSKAQSNVIHFLENFLRKHPQGRYDHSKS